jgi:hypothetical protein
MFTSGKAIRGRRPYVRLLSGWKRIAPRILAALGLAMALAGCEPVQSLCPFFDPKDVVYDSELLGMWVSKTEDGFYMKLCFQKAQEEANAYKVDFIVYNDKPEEDKPKEGTITFSVHLFQAGDSRFADFYPLKYLAKWDSRTVEFEATDNFFGVPTHTVYQVKMDKNHLQLAWLDDNYVKKFLTENGLSLAADDADHFVLTGKTDDLKANLLVRAEKEDLLSHDDGFEFVLQK